MKNFLRKFPLGETSIFFGCLAVYLFLFFLYSTKFAFIGTDGVSYALIAKSLAEGKGLTLFGSPSVYFSPAFPVFVVPFYWVLGDVETSARVAMASAGVGSLIFLYLIMRRITERTSVALFAVGLLAFDATFTARPIIVAQPLACFLSLGLLFFLLKFSEAQKNNTHIFRFTFLLGLLSGLLYLTRPEYFFIFIPLSIFLFFTNKKEIPLRKNFLAVFTALLGFFLLASPYIFYLHAHTGEWSFMSTSRLPTTVTSVNGLSYADMKLEKSPVLPGNQMEIVLEKMSSGPFVKSYMENILSMEKIMLLEFGIFGVIFLGLGLRFFIIERKSFVFKAVVVVWSIMFILALGHNGERGYLLSYIPLCIIFISAGVFSFADELPQKWYRFFLFTCFAFLSIVFSFNYWQNFFFRPPETWRPAEYQELGEWFQANVKNFEQEKITARKPEISFYSGASWAEISEKEGEGSIFLAMKEKGSHYLVIDTRSFGENAPLYINKECKFLGKSKVEFVEKFTYYGQTACLFRFSDKNYERHTK